jgi:hypothetical protein
MPVWSTTIHTQQSTFLARRFEESALRCKSSGVIAEGQSEPAILQEFFERWVSPLRNATIANLHRGMDAGELRSETEPELVNDAIFGAIYYRMLLHSGRRYGEEVVEQVLRGHLSLPGRGRSD